MPPTSSAHQSAGGPCSDAVMASSHGSEETRAMVLGAAGGVSFPWMQSS
jgi:hypothetical protein